MTFYDKISYHFQNEKLLDEALTHPSFSREHKSSTNYQRLEFLGDKVLSLVISEFLIQKYQKEDEGNLSIRHASLVSGDALTKIALEIGIEEVIKVGKGEENCGGKTNKRNLENALEALIGAIYLDSNYENTKNFILKFWKNLLDENSVPPKDPVSQLQEFIQLKFKKLPQYIIEKSGGSDHSPRFTCKLHILEEGLEFFAEGASKKEAQREAAKLALKHYELA